MPFCTKCGKQNADTDKFCSQCGAVLIKPPEAASYPMQQSESIPNNIPPVPAPVQDHVLVKKSNSKYRNLLMTLMGIGFIFIPIYTLFLKDDPVKNGKNLGKAYCDCGNKNQAKKESDIKAYLDSFDSYHFKSKPEARTKLDAISGINQTIYDSCIASVIRKFSDYRLRYEKEGGKTFSEFEVPYSMMVAACFNSSSASTLSLTDTANSRIMKIIDPEPDATKMKMDLLNTEIIGWKFSSLSEFQKFEITNQVKGVDQIDYTVDLSVQGPEDKWPHDVELNLTYKEGTGGWSLSIVKEIFITFTDEAPVGSWLKITPFPNSSYTISNDKKFFAKDGDYGQTYKGGPDGEAFNLTSSYIYVASGEDVPVNLVFTYKPRY